MWWCESNNILPSFFYEFRRGKPCHDCLSNLFIDSIIAKNKKKLIGVLSLDLEGAYDKVNLQVLIDTLKELKIPSKFITFVFNLINDRNIIGMFNSQPFKNAFTNKGLPQGYILSPLLFNLYLYAISTKLHPGIKCLSFADDILIYCRDANPAFISSELNLTINSLNNWFESISLKIAPHKCSYTFLGFNADEIPSGSHCIKLKNQSTISLLNI